MKIGANELFAFVIVSVGVVVLVVSATIIGTIMANWGMVVFDILWSE